MKTLAIVGSHPLTRDNAPWNDDVDVWVFNEAANQAWCKRVSAVIQIHSPAVYKNPENRTDRGHWEWLQREHGYPVYMQSIDPLVPDSVEYPLEDVLRLCDNVKLFGNPIQYLTSSISYAIAQAILKGYEKLLIYGIEMSSDTEYAYQRDGTAFWLGLAIGKGIQVELYSGNQIFTQPLYGYDSNIEQDLSDLESRKVSLLAEVTKWRDVKSSFEQTWLSECDVDGKIGEALTNLLDASIELGKFEGKLSVINEIIFKVKQMESGFIDRQEFEAGSKKNKVIADEKQTMVHRIAGRMDGYFAIYESSKNPQALLAIKDIAIDFIKTGYESGLHQGKHEENTRLMDDLDMKIRAAGGMKAVEAIKEA